ncbi:MAG: preprotein translocase subunit SecG [Deltaproteobacteria bacterium]|jgi:preprotein translocase subunit SecG|nr:preprotein translocase subunit SecG [Deltaproteobacteria bacterium]
MSAAITTIHVTVAVILMISVLLQTGKGSGLGAAFGGSSSSVFGARGPATFISRVTSVAAVIFMATSLTLSIFAQSGGSGASMVTDDDLPAPAQSAAQTSGAPVTEEELQQSAAPAEAGESAAPAEAGETPASAEAGETAQEAAPVADQAAGAHNHQ